MFCKNQVVHTIQPGDTLYRLAIVYNTTVPALLQLNPGVEIYNLRIGSGLIVCPGVNIPPVVPPIGTVPPITPPIGTLPPVRPIPPIGTICPPCPDCPECPVCPDMELSNLMRKLWSQHVYWTRMLLISIADRLRDQDATTARLLQNPKDIANVFAQYFGQDAANKISMLLTEHLQIGGKLMTALRDKRTAEADYLTQQWYTNANKMAAAFSSINPKYNREELQKMLYEHLKLTTDEVAMRLAGNYPQDIEAFNKVETEALNMADYFTAGLL